jgi:hypothetical protein
MNHTYLSLVFSGLFGRQLCKNYDILEKIYYTFLGTIIGSCLFNLLCEIFLYPFYSFISIFTAIFISEISEYYLSTIIINLSLTIIVFSINCNIFTTMICVKNFYDSHTIFTSLFFPTFVFILYYIQLNLTFYLSFFYSLSILYIMVTKLSMIQDVNRYFVFYGFLFGFCLQNVNYNVREISDIFCHVRK